MWKIETLTTDRRVISGVVENLIEHEKYSDTNPKDLSDFVPWYGRDGFCDDCSPFGGGVSRDECPNHPTLDEIRSIVGPYLQSESPARLIAVEPDEETIEREDDPAGLNEFLAMDDLSLPESPTDPPTTDEWDAILAEPPEEDWTSSDYQKRLSEDQTLSPMALLAGVMIIRRCWQKKVLFAPPTVVAGWMHLAPSSHKTAKRALAELVANGYLRPTVVVDRVQHYALELPIKINIVGSQPTNP